MSNHGGLAEYRKKLHTLLHNNTPASAQSTSKNVKFQTTTYISPTDTIKPTNKTNDNVKLIKKIQELENVIDSKNKKIVILSKANLEKVETIKELNSKCKNLEGLNVQNNKRIEQLEKIIIDMQRSYTQHIKEEEEHQYNVINEDGDDDSVDEDADNILAADYDLTKNLISRTTSRNSNIDTEINLNTQQLLNLDINQLTIHNSGVGIYNNALNEDGDDIDNYLFEV